MEDEVPRKESSSFHALGKYTLYRVQVESRSKNEKDDGDKRKEECHHVSKTNMINMFLTSTPYQTEQIINPL